MLNTIKAVFLCALAASLMICAFVVTRDVHCLLLRADSAVVKADGAVGQVERTAKLAADYAEKQKVILESPRNQKALEAGWQTAAVLNGTAKDINKVLIPLVKENLKGLGAAMGSFDASAQALTALVRNTDRNLNDGLLPSLAETAKTLGVSMQAVTASVQTIAAKGSVSIDEINALLADPQWLEILKNIAATTAHADATAGNIEKASQSAPSIAASIDRIAATSSKYQKLLLLAQLLATIARAF
ncbi:MAG: hypothetical protein LAP85_25240 [Acidobacteriia bacterium]|nr:hypothetical protein [Terriglobia bacterium]